MLGSPRSTSYRATFRQLLPCPQRLCSAWTGGTGLAHPHVSTYCALPATSSCLYIYTFNWSDVESQNYFQCTGFSVFWPPTCPFYLFILEFPLFFLSLSFDNSASCQIMASWEIVAFQSLSLDSRLKSRWNQVKTHLYDGKFINVNSQTHCLLVFVTSRNYSRNFTSTRRSVLWLAQSDFFQLWNKFSALRQPHC